jgi:hypothetical protein
MTARTLQTIDPPSPLRVRRGTAALIAQYIHELSGQHGASRRHASPDAVRTLPRPDRG